VDKSFLVLGVAVTALHILAYRHTRQQLFTNFF
jgi:hypothetical protein